MSIHYIEILKEWLLFTKGDLDELQGYFAEDAEFYRLGYEGKYNLTERRESGKL
jgi:hypothetical protein